MSRKWIATVAVIAAAGGIAAGATAVLGEGGGVERPDISRLAVSVNGSSAAAASAPAQASSKTKVIYRSSEVQSVPSEAVDVDIGKCPKKSKVLNGFYEADNADHAIVTSHPVGKRSWRLRLNSLQFNGTGGDYEAVFGIVCAQNKPG